MAAWVIMVGGVWSSAASSVASCSSGASVPASSTGADLLLLFSSSSASALGSEAVGRGGRVFGGRRFLPLASGLSSRAYTEVHGVNGTANSTS